MVSFSDMSNLKLYGSTIYNKIFIYTKTFYIA